MSISRRTILVAAATGLAAPKSTLAGLADLEELTTKDDLVGLVAAVSRDGRAEIMPFGQMSHDGRPMQADTQFRVASLTRPVTAFAAMMLVDDGMLTLDGPVDEWLPELANRRVLRAIDGPLDDTVPADRPISLRDLLTCRFGLGAIMVFPPDLPIQKAMAKAGIAPGYLLPQLSADDYLRATGSLPLAAQPGTRFLYNNGLDVAGILIQRASGKSLGEFMADRIFGPLGMTDTAFQGDPARLATLYGPEGAMEGPEMAFTAPPPMQSGAAGLVSTAPDFLGFMAMMLDGGRVDGQALITPASLDEMLRDQLTADQRAAPDAALILGDGQGWGLGLGIVRDGGGPFGLSAGSFGWVGGYGTCAYADPARGLAGVLMTGKSLTSAEPPGYMQDFWRQVSQ